MRTILHITPHLGGGVGRVLRNYLNYTRAHEEDRHLLACLDYANATSTAWAAATGITLTEHQARRLPELLETVARADLVVLHWWNHPLLYELMVRHPLPPARVLLWSHVSGHTPPQNFSQALLAYPDLFVVATPYSFEAPAIRRLSLEQRNERLRLVFSCAGVNHVAQARPLPHEGFRIGYIGTVDYVKMHREFLKMSAAARIPGVRFVVCGGPQDAAIHREAQEAGIADKFDFLGHVDDVAQVLSHLDVFGYPLAPGHYGTGEQVLIEALAAGVPAVVLDNGPEGYVVEDRVTGIVAQDEAAYTSALELLFHNPDLRLAMSGNARRRARQRFPIEKTAQAWHALYTEVLELPKRPRCWPANFPGGKVTAAEVFINALGEYGIPFSQSFSGCDQDTVFAADDLIARLPGLFRSDTRGSVFHYRSFFPDDPHLNLWAGLMLQADGKADQAIDRFDEAHGGLEPWRLSRYLPDHGIQAGNTPETNLRTDCRPSG